MAIENIFDYNEGYDVDVSELSAPSDYYDDPDLDYAETYEYSDDDYDYSDAPTYEEQWDPVDLSFDAEDPDYNFDFSEDDLSYLLDEEFREGGVPTLEDDKKREVDGEGERDSLWQMLLDNKELLSYLAQTGIGMLSGYGKVIPTKTGRGGGGGTPTSSAPGGKVGKVSRSVA